MKIKEPMYAVQSALYFWNEGTKYNNKYAVEHADEDDITSVSKAINLYDSANLANRETRYNNARKENAFDIVRHFTDIYENGNESQKEQAKNYFEKWKDKDEKALEKYNEINNIATSQNEETTEPQQNPSNEVNQPNSDKQ